MASGGIRRIKGSFVGDGAQRDVKTVGFRPSEVTLYNVGGNAYATWQESMPDGAMQKTIDNGTEARVSLVTGGAGVTPLAEGFRLGADADLNAAGETVHWVATD